MSGAMQTVLAPPAGPARRAVRDPLVAGLVGLCLAVAVGLLVARPAPYLVNALGQLAAFAILAVSLDLVWGYLGILSLGHGLFFAIGGYVCAMHLLSHGVAVTGVLPDFVQFMGWKSLPAYWAGLDHPAYALVLALALAGLVMAAKLPVRLHLLIPAVENAIAADAFRPGDVLRSRKGLSVENTNTDAEGRLILGDALTRAGEEKPELILDFATLTGAARVALGPDLPPLFTDDEALARDLLAAGDAQADPMWRLPLWDGYDDLLKSDIADLQNAPDGGFAGAITAALFLRRFVPAGAAWAHLDVFAWRPTAKPGRPKGGDAYALRASWAMLKARYGR